MITQLELNLLAYIDNDCFGDRLTDDIWFWPSEIAKALGVTTQGVGGVVTSLQGKGLITVYIDGSDSTIGMTEAGADAYVAARPNHKKPR